MEGLENLRYLLNPGDYFMKIDLFGCLPIYFSPRRLTTLPGIYFQPGHVCFQNDAIRAKRGASPIYKSLQTSFGRSDGTVYSSSHMARRYPSNLKFLFKLHSRSRHCYGPTSEPRFLVKHRKVSPHSNSQSHLPRYGDRFVNHDIFSSRREGFSNCSKATILRNKNQVSVREIYQFIGMCSATHLAVKEAPIHYRQLQHQVITLLKENLLLRN